MCKHAIHQLVSFVIMHIHVFTTDVLPQKGFPTNGMSLRTDGLIEGLRSKGVTVTISIPRVALAQFIAQIPPAHFSPQLQHTIQEYEALAFDQSNQADIIRQINPDAVLCAHWPAVTFPEKLRQPLIVDLAGPFLLQHSYTGRKNYKDLLRAKLSILSRSDIFITSGPSQERYFQSYFHQAGVTDNAKRSVRIMMALPPQFPEYKGIGENLRFLFSGLFMPWQNPQPAISVLLSELKRRRRGILHIIGGEHPYYNVKSWRHRLLVRRLRKTTNVFIEPLLSFSDYVDRLQHSAVALDLLARNPERELAVPIRTAIYLWAGLPVIYNNYSDFSSLIANHDAGWCVDPADKSQLALIIDEIFSDPAVLATKSKNAQALARKYFCWDSVVEPLLTMLGGKELPREANQSKWQNQL